MTAINFFTQTATLYSKSGYTGDGDQIFGAGFSVACKFVEGIKIMKRGTTEEYQADARMYVPVDTTVSAESKATFNGVDYEVVEVTTQRGTVTGLGHKKMMLKRTKV